VIERCKVILICSCTFCVGKIMRTSVIRMLLRNNCVLNLYLHLCCLKHPVHKITALLPMNFPVVDNILESSFKSMGLSVGIRYLMLFDWLFCIQYL
jgi:hypothetical protein